MIAWLPDDDPRWFPPTDDALGPGSDAAGLLAVGGDLRPERLNEAYRRGIFPWFSPGQPPLWWSLDPRMVLKVDEFALSRSLRRTLLRFIDTPGCAVRFDADLPGTLADCADTPRAGQAGTWILPEMQAAYARWHRQGRVHSVETWMDGQRVGGLYVVNLGRMVYGESMFAHRTDASKIALAALVAFCRAEGIPWIDCQQQTRHLASMGARPVPRAEFEAHLAGVVDLPPPARWAYDRAHWRHLGLGLDALAPSETPPPPA